MPAMISTETKICETLNHGSVPAALKANFFTPLELLNYLATISDETLNLKLRFQAYACVRDVLKPEQQFLSDGKHFLIVKPEYVSAFLGIFNPKLLASIPAHVDEPESTIFASEPVRKVIHEFSTDPGLRKFVTDILGNFLNSEGMFTSGTFDMKPDIVMNSIKIRSAPEIFFRELLKPDTYNGFMVLGDWTDNLYMNTKLVDFVLKRARKLTEKAPLYYARVAYPMYHKVLTELNKRQLLRLSQEDLAAVNKLFPNIIDARILALTDEAFKIFDLGPESAAYVLGFPIQNGTPSADEIFAALDKLQQLGVSGYAETLKAYVQSTYAPCTPLFAPTDHKFKYLNDTDVFLEYIHDYVPFDIVSYTIGGFVYCFTRPEFKNLLTTGKNSWTNQELPVGILATMRARLSAAKALGLPKSQIFTDLVSSILKPDSEVYAGAYVFEPAPGFMGARIPWNTDFLATTLYPYPIHMQIPNMGHDDDDEPMPVLEDADNSDNIPGAHEAHEAHERIYTIMDALARAARADAHANLRMEDVD